MKTLKKRSYEWFFLKNYIARMSDADFDRLITARNHYKLNHANQQKQAALKQLLLQLAEDGDFVKYENQAVKIIADI